MSVKKDLKNIKFEKILEKNEYNCLKYRKKNEYKRKIYKKKTITRRKSQKYKFYFNYLSALIEIKLQNDYLGHIDRAYCSNKYVHPYTYPI